MATDTTPVRETPTDPDAPRRADLLDPKDLVEEMAIIYEFLNDTFVLAMQRLEGGGVSAFDQWSFWQAFEKLDNWFDGDLMEWLPTEQEKMDCRTPFATRAEWLCEALRLALQHAEQAHNQPRA